MSKVLNFGSLNIDYVYSVERFVRAGETISSLNMEIFCGGKGLNQSIALARAGASVYHAGAVGEDGEVLLNTLISEQIDVSQVCVQSGRSGHAIIQTDVEGQNCIMLFGGANRKISNEHVEATLTGFSEGDYLILQNEINNNEKIMSLAKNKGMKIVLNPSPMDDAAFNLPLELVDMFVLNEVEAEILCGVSCPEKMMQRLKLLFPNVSILLTLGEKGALYLDSEMEVPMRHCAYKVSAVDTTAAGDTFMGFFISCIAKGESIEKSLEVASKASAITVSNKGASVSIPMMEDVMAARFMPSESDFSFY